MKRIILAVLVLGNFCIVNAQSDTLFTKKQKKIPCKISEISELDIKYTLADNPGGPVYVISKSTIFRYTLSNGYSELVVPDELSIENEHGDILKNRQVIKIHPFSLVNNQVSVAYEKVIKVGMNMDIEGGYINNSINKNPLINSSPFRYNYYYNSYYNFTENRIFYSGGYIKPGVKFFLGQDYSVKGLKYAHPLKGRYIRLELAVSYLNYKNIRRFEYNTSTSVTNTISTNVNAVAYGGFVSYGRQFILGNILTLEYFASLGFTGLSYNYTNPEFLKNTGNTYYYVTDEAKDISNFHGFQRISGLGLSGSVGFRLGYILPDKKAVRKPGLNRSVHNTH